MRIQAFVAVLALEIIVATGPTALRCAEPPAAAQNPFTALADAAKQKAAETAIETLLNNQLPLTLDAKDVYPTVDTLPADPSVRSR